MTMESAAIRASFERSLTDLESVAVVRMREAVGAPDTMREMATTATAPKKNGAVKTAAASNAENDMRGSQIQTAVDHGDYGSQAEAVGAQKEETHRKPDGDGGPLGNQTDSINFANGQKYTLARRLAAIRTIAEFNPTLAAQLEKQAMGGDTTAPLGGTPPAVAEGQAAASGAAPGADSAMPGDTSMDPTAAGGAPGGEMGNFMEISRQLNEDAQKKKQDAAVAEELAKKFTDAMSQGQTGAAMSGGGGVTAKATKVAGDKDTPQIKPEHKVDTAVERQYANAPQRESSDPDDLLFRQSTADKDKGNDGESNNIKPSNSSQRNPGSYPLTAGKNGTANGKTAVVDWSLYDEVKVNTATRTKTAEADELQPVDKVDAKGTYSGKETGDQADDAIAHGSTPTLESAETKSVVDSANSEMKSRSGESMKGSSTAAKVAIFTDKERTKLKLECKLVDDTRDALAARVKSARKMLVHGEDVARTAQVRIAALKACGDAIEASLNHAGHASAEGVSQIRKAAADLVRRGRDEVALAKREGGYIGAALIEAKRAQDREGRIGPAFGLAVSQLQAGLLTAEELPAKTAEYMAMDSRAFEIVAKAVQEVGEKVRRQAQPKTARRIPSVGESLSPNVPVDELAGLFDNE